MRPALAYPIRDGIPIMLPDEARPLAGTAPGSNARGGVSPGPVVPNAVRLDRAARRLTVDFGALGAFDFPAEFLRVHSPSAEVQGHSPRERRLVAGRRGVGIAGLEPVGRYALRIRFDDGHDTGLYTWDGLLTLGRTQDALWQDYLQRLAQAGLGRDAA